MKRFSIIYLLLAAFLSFCNCTTEEFVQEEQHESGIKVYADFSDTKTSQTSANGVTSTTWVEGDMIGIFTEQQENLCYVADRSGKSTGFSAEQMQMEAKEGEKIYAYYPYQSYGNSGKSVKLPNTQTQWGDLGTSTYDVLYAEGTVKNNEVALKFKHLYAFLKITIPTSLLVVKDDISNTFVIKVASEDSYISQASGRYYNRYNLETKEIEYGGQYNLCNYIYYHIEEEEVANKQDITCYVAILPQDSNSTIGIYSSYDTSKKNLLRSVNAPKDGFEAGKVYTININETTDSERERTLQALTALYNSTDGDNWKNNTNWLSDEPFNSWYGLNDDYTLETKQVHQINLSGNNLRGTLPPEFAYLMDDAIKINMENNILYGKIPKEVREHPKWQELGWNLLSQNYIKGGGWDYSEGTGLVFPDKEISLILEDNDRNISDILSSNELTLIVDANRRTYFDINSDECINYFLGYSNKGMGMIVSLNEPLSFYPYEDYKEYIIEKQRNGVPAEILWSKDVIQFDHSSNTGYIYLVDKNCHILGFWEKIYTDYLKDWYIEQLDDIVKAKLGEPEDHPTISTKYNSTDYTSDGDVVTLQTAEEGAGIDIILLGDAFSDRLIADGRYDDIMMTAYENFFEEEPYKSYKKLFNVYYVTVVSKNEIYGGETALECYFDQIPKVGGNNSKCFEYALKAIDAQRMDEALIIVMMNSTQPGGTCYMYYGSEGDYGSGAAIAYFPIGEYNDFAGVLHHEAAGHGFSKLGDEYAYESNGHITTGEVDYYYATAKDFGWWKNIDFTADPMSVKWANFISDSRYTSENIGTFEGGCAYWTGVWRPTENSIMRSNYGGFNAPSREAIYYRIHKLAYGESWEYDYEKFVEFDQANKSPETAMIKERRTVNYVEKTDNLTAPPIVIGKNWRNSYKQSNDR